MIERNNR